MQRPNKVGNLAGRVEAQMLDPTTAVGELSDAHN
jgi:hypothetical protein